MMKNRYILWVVLALVFLAGCSSNTAQDKNALTDEQSTYDYFPEDEAVPGNPPPDAQDPGSQPPAQDSPASAPKADNAASEASGKAGNQQGTSGTEKAAAPDGAKKAAAAGNERTGLTGEVASVSGNSIVIKLTEMPQRNGEERKGQPPADGEKPAVQQEGQKSGEQGERPQPAVKYTGETKTITVASGISITAMGRGEKGAEPTKLEVKDIKVGDMISVWYSDQAAGTISRISVMAKR